MNDEIDELLKQGYAYAEFAKQFLPMDSAIEIQHALLAHFLFPNLNETEREFLARLRLVQALYSIHVNEFEYDKDGKEERTRQATHELEQEFMNLKNNPQLAEIKTKLMDLQKSLLEKHFENMEFLPPR